MEGKFLKFLIKGSWGRSICFILEVKDVLEWIIIYRDVFLGFFLGYLSWWVFKVLFWKKCI